MDKIIEVKKATCESAVKAETSDGGEMVLVRVPQGYDAKINIRIVPGHDIHLTPRIPSCQPRQGASRRDIQPVALPESLAVKLAEADKMVINWLAQDEANAKLYMEQPVESLIKAGVKLTRSDQKLLKRAHSMVEESSVVPPGVKVTDFYASADPKGRVDELALRPIFKDGESENNCSCRPRRKE
ncbi:hypothetical protein FTO70_14520 [Methanosarcina sp. KYL-1]|uniref:hypothetical protein n=1 Tax=Methanosarcina sp. KYL-1 TaxID=2602068 RepID=UPI002100874A|nr:hypothetical protein [Methanosarcina sp. KYL-1]MCQ1536862.1 hypothetical protein [Methanosarcina sp. KYL-1]